MTTVRQALGERGENLVAKLCPCPRCKRSNTLCRLPANFKCADVICDFCGYLAQVKAVSVKDPDVLPKRILGAAWGVQKERMDAGIYFPLFVVLFGAGRPSIFYLSADLQPPGMFVPRAPLSSAARRAGWQGFVYDLSKVSNGAIVRVV